MKKIFISLSISLNLALIGLLLLSNTNTQKESKNQPYIQCDSCTSYANYPPFNYLDVDMLHAMANKYKTTITSNVNGKIMVSQFLQNKVEDSKSIWFSLDSIKRFIWEIETNMCKNQCITQVNKHELGIRLYYARYPLAYKRVSPFKQLLSLNPSYQNLHTIFMVPTYNENGVDWDFDPRLRTAKNCRPSIENGTQALIFAPLNTSAQNHGSLCPPLNCDGATFK